MFILQYRDRRKQQTKSIYGRQLRCCSGYGPTPNCPRKLHLLLM